MVNKKIYWLALEDKYMFTETRDKSGSFKDKTSIQLVSKNNMSFDH